MRVSGSSLNLGRAYSRPSRSAVLPAIGPESRPSTIARRRPTAGLYQLVNAIRDALTEGRPRPGVPWPAGEISAMNATETAAALRGRVEEVCRRYLPHGRKRGPTYSPSAGSYPEPVFRLFYSAGDPTQRDPVRCLQ